LKNGHSENRKRDRLTLIDLGEIVCGDGRWVSGVESSWCIAR